MTREQIKERVRSILVQILKLDRFEMIESLTSSDVDGWDSLTHMMIISAIEDDLNVRFKLRELNQLTDIGSLITLIQEKLS